MVINKNLPTIERVNKYLDGLNVGDEVECGVLSKSFNLTSNAVSGRFVAQRDDFKKVRTGRYRKIILAK